MKTFDIYFNDLTVEAKIRLLNLVKEDDEDERDWNLVPLASVDFEVEDDDETDDDDEEVDDETDEDVEEVEDD